MKNSAKQGCENMEIKMTTTDTPRTDACPHCGAKPMIRSYVCGTTLPNINGDCYVSDLCHEREARQKAETEVEFWKSKAYEAEFHEGKHEAEVERLRSTMRSFIDFMDENLGTTADWPMEAAFDDEETCQKHCDLLNAMKRIVKPEDIN